MVFAQRFLGWLGRLSVGRKLMLIYLLDLTAVIYVSGILIHEKYLSIDFTRKEIVGTEYTQAISGAVMQAFLTPQSDSSAARQRLAQARLAHDDTLQTAAAAQALEAALDQQALLNQQKASPARLNDASLQTLQRARELLTTVGNQSNLILDPDLDSYYVMSLVVLRYPELLQAIEASRDFVMGQNGTTAQSYTTELLSLRGRLDAVLQGIEADHTQAMLAGSPELKASLQPPREALKVSVLALEDLMLNIAAGQSPDVLSAMPTLHRQALVALDAAWKQGTSDLDRLLQQRVDGLFARMWLHLGTALVLLAFILGLVTLVARQIAKPLQHLAGVADEVRRSGDHTRRAQWSSRDEIGQLVAAFNDMLAQLDRERLLQQELAASARAAEAQRELVEALPVPMMVTSVPEHEVLHANAPAQPWLGGRQMDPWRVGLDPGVRARFFQRLADHGVVDEFEVRWKGGDEPSWAVLSARRLRYQGREALLTAFTPINVLKVMEQRLELWAKVFEASSESIIIMDPALKIVSVNRAFCRSTSYDFYEVIGETLSMLLDDDEDNPVGAQVLRLLKDKESWQGEVRLRRRSGETYPAWLMVSAVREKQKEAEITQYIGIALDITDRKQNEERIQFLAHHDVLTELPNRSLCVQRLEQALAQARVSGEQLAVLFIDLDRFKTINDTLGHHIGDGLLRSVALRLSQSVRGHDTVSRLGGDEFVIILRNVASKDEVAALVERRLIPQIRQSHTVEGHELNVSCSVGIAVYPDDGADIDELMRRADAAMYEAKTSGRDMARFFSPETDQRAMARQSVEHHLRRALERGEFSLCFQPRLNARTHDLIGAEALLRWNSAELGPVSPATFIPVAEETGLIRPIGAWVLQEACAQWVRWRQWPASHPLASVLGELNMSVNLSAAQLADPQLVSELRELLNTTGMDPDHLELELTESQLMENAQAAQQQIASLKTLGLKLSIDDFGTGYSSLAYLKRFEIDKLKVDKSFVDDIFNDPADMAITRAVIALGHTLGLKVVAEGVENLATAQVLGALDCDELQGYHFSRPLPAAEFEAWAAAHLGTPAWSQRADARAPVPGPAPESPA